jgi:hypothetical protein
MSFREQDGKEQGDDGDEEARDVGDGRHGIECKGCRWLLTSFFC